AIVKVSIEEPASQLGSSALNQTASTKAKKTKTITFDLGKHDSEKAKIYVRVQGVPRINAVEDAVLKLVERPALAYRNRRVLDFADTDLAKVEVKREGGPFTLQQVKGTWRLASPVQADVDSSKASQLAGDLARLDAVEYISETATPDALDRLYGLAKPAVSAQLSFTDSKKPTETLQIGKQRDTKAEYFAKLTSAPGVFLVKKELRDALDQDSLSLRPLQLWQVGQEDIVGLKVQKDGPEYTLKRDGQSWTIGGPFEAPAVADTIKPMAEELSNPR